MNIEERKMMHVYSEEINAHFIFKINTCQFKNLMLNQNLSFTNGRSLEYYLKNTAFIKSVTYGNLFKDTGRQKPYKRILVFLKEYLEDKFEDVIIRDYEIKMLPINGIKVHKDAYKSISRSNLEKESMKRQGEYFVICTDSFVGWSKRTISKTLIWLNKGV